MRRSNSQAFDPNAERMPLNAFWEALEKRLEAFSADELRVILRGMAQATPPAQRHAFLEQLKAAKGAADSRQKKLRHASQDLLDDIDDLIQDIQTAAVGRRRLGRGRRGPG